MSEKDQHDGCNCGHEQTDEQLLNAQAGNVVNMAIAWLQKDRLDAAEAHLTSAAKLIALSGNADSLAAGRYHNARSMLAQKSGHKKAAVRHSRKSFAIYKKVYAADHYMIAIGQMNLGECLAEAGHPKGRQIMAEALETFKAADVGTKDYMVAWKEQTIQESIKVLSNFN